MGKRRNSSSRSRRVAVPVACYADTTWEREGDYNEFVCRCKGSRMSDLSTRPPYYRIYLLTVWQEQSRGPPESIIWRFRLEDPRTGWQGAFADAESFMAALYALAGSGERTDGQARKEE
jgi:hypothetical protein